MVHILNFTLLDEFKGAYLSLLEYYSKVSSLEKKIQKLAGYDINRLAEFYRWKLILESLIYECSLIVKYAEASNMIALTIGTCRVANNILNYIREFDNTPYLNEARHSLLALLTISETLCKLS